SKCESPRSVPQARATSPALQPLADNNEPDGVYRIIQMTAHPQYCGKRTRVHLNAFKWTSTEPPTNVRALAHNILKLGALPGMTTSVSVLDPEPEAIKIWTLLFTEDLLADITQWTNAEIEYYRAEDESRKHQSKFRLVDMVGMKVFFDDLIFITIYEANHENYTDKFLGLIYRTIMSPDRLEVLLSC
ncbi:hypothetical protein HHI36_013907, partial [Cryptolaemus montrouzieri]